MRHRRRRQPTKRIFKHETLESRRMMSGDGVGVGLAAADETVQTATYAGTAAATNFESIEALRQWIAREATERDGELFGTTQTQPGWRDWCYACDGDGIRVLPTLMNTTITTAAVDFSETNTQVAGVDEADLVETDGEFVYLLSGKELIIVDARDPDDLRIASRVELTDRPSGMYLTGDRLTLVSSSQPSYYGGGLVLSSLYWGGGTPAQPTVTVTVLDLTDRTAPTQVEQTEIDGTLLSSRLVDGQLRLVTQQNANRYLPSPNYTMTAKEAIAVESVEPAAEPAGQFTSLRLAGDIDYYIPRDYEYTYETLDEYVDRVVAQWTPGYRTLSADGVVIDSGFLIDPTDIEIPDPNDINGWGYFSENNTTVMTFDVTDEAAGPSDKLVLQTGYGANLHGTADGLYVLANGRTVGTTDVYRAPHLKITKLSFAADGAITSEASGEVEGSLLNQFAVDEHDGYLRVVTTTGGWRNSDQQLTVLEQDDDELVEVGVVGSLAPGETIHSVRFMGDEAYVVTFRRVDPLFAINLSDPTNPTIDGELKIPGFSDYLHPIGEDHLLGIGRGADEQSGIFEELQVSIFDVTNLSDPQLTHRHSVDGGRSTESIATGNRWAQGDGDHHAVAFYEDEGVLALPIQHANNWWGFFDASGEPAEGELFAPGEGGLLVLSIDVTAGISEIALIEHETPIQRSLQIGDTLIAVSAGQISTHDFGGLDGELDRLDLTVVPATRPVAYTPPGRESIPTTIPTTDPAGSTGVAAETGPATEATETEPTARTRTPFVPTAREALSPRPASRFSARTTISPAARDAALLLIDRAIADEGDLEFSANSESDSDDETATEPTERGVRSAWRSSVRGV